MTSTTRRVVWRAAAVLAVLVLAGCHTVGGIGRDLEGLGYAIQDAAD